MTRDSKTRTTLGAARQLVLTLGAFLGVLAFLAALAAIGFGVKPLVFRSGSMAPEINTGGLALARHVDAEQLHVGDIVSVINDSGVRITHRVIGVDIDTNGTGGTATLTLKGDANQVADATPYVVDGADRIFWHVDRLGYAVAWLSSPTAMFVGGLLAAWLIATAFKRRPDRPAPVARGTHRAVSEGAGFRGVKTLAVLAAMAAVVAVGAKATGTLAAWTDPAAATGGTFRTASVAEPTNLACRQQGGVFDRRGVFTWDGPNGGASPTGYKVTYTRGSSTASATVTQETWTMPTNLTTGTYNVTVQSVAGAWTSAPTAAESVTLSSFFGIWTQYDC